MTFRLRSHRSGRERAILPLFLLVSLGLHAVAARAIGDIEAPPVDYVPVTVEWMTPPEPEPEPEPES